MDIKREKPKKFKAKNPIGKIGSGFSSKKSTKQPKLSVTKTPKTNIPSSKDVKAAYDKARVSESKARKDKGDSSW